MCHMTRWCMVHIYGLYGTYLCVTWLVDVCGMTHLYLWHDSFRSDAAYSLQKTKALTMWQAFVCVTWLIHMWNDSVWQNSFIRVTWHIHTWHCIQMTKALEIFGIHSYLINVCDMTHIRMCDMTHSYVTLHAVSRWLNCMVHIYVRLYGKFFSV